ncbi:MAG: flagellin FliC [Alphaproteobacteria bacterium]|nr:flagellin FliC [Alphaproteobacteria bacterium]
MALTVNTNTTALSSMTSLNRTNRSFQSTLGRISSGSRVNKAADDAAGLAVAENLRAENRSVQAAKRNTQDGISVIQTAEGATAEVADILKRMRELAVQSSSETLEDTERAYIQDEYTQLADETDRIANVTSFNGLNLTDNSNPTLDVQVGVNNSPDDRITINFGDLTTATLGVDTGSLDLGSSTGAQSAITAIDSAIDMVSGYRSAYGSVQNRLESAMRNLETYSENLSVAESGIRDADFAKEAAEMAKFNVMQQAGIAALGQANQINSGAVRLIG